MNVKAELTNEVPQGKLIADGALSVTEFSVLLAREIAIRSNSVLPQKFACSLSWAPDLSMVRVVVRERP